MISPRCLSSQVRHFRVTSSLGSLRTERSCSRVVMTLLKRVMFIFRRRLAARFEDHIGVGLGRAADMGETGLF
jgi:hypothetical protein